MLAAGGVPAAAPARAGIPAPAPARAAARARECDVPGRHRTIDGLWRPDMRSALAYARSRMGDIAFAVRTDGRFTGYRADHQEWSASVVKAMLLVAYLDEPWVANRPVNDDDNAMLIPMIERSDNTAAERVDGIVGNAGLAALARRVGMTHFVPSSVWGRSLITARDQTLFFLHLDRFVAPRHRRYAMHLLASVIPAQRWGIGQVTPHGWTAYFKGGWGYATGLLDHQVVLLKRGCARVSIAVLSMRDGYHAYGMETLRGIFTRLLHGFPRFT